MTASRLVCRDEFAQLKDLFALVLDLAILTTVSGGEVVSGRAPKRSGC
jgi:hypothetical protein